MGFMMFCVLVYLVAIAIWGAIKSEDERAKLAAEFKEKPAQSIFMIVWIGAIFLFFNGIFAPIFGEAEFFDTGWEIWKVGGLASLAGWIITWFWRTE